MWIIVTWNGARYHYATFEEARREANRMPQYRYCLWSNEKCASPRCTGKPSATPA